MPTLCPDCQVWEIIPTDNFCAFCRRKFISLGISIHPAHIPAGEIRQIVLTIHNLSGEKPIQVSSIRTSAEWLSGDFSRIALPFPVLPNSDFEMLLFADSAGLESAVAEVSVESSAGNDTAGLEISPFPEVRLEAEHGGKCHLVLDQTQDARASVRVIVASGKVSLRGITVSPADIGAPVTAFSLPAELSPAAAPAEILLRFDKEVLRQQQRELPCRVNAQFRDAFENEFECGIDLTVCCSDPPEMMVWEQYDPQCECSTGEPHTFRLTIQNVDRALKDLNGRAPLEILAVEAVDSDGAAIPWIERLTDLSQPLRIDSGQTARVEFKVFPQGSSLHQRPEVGAGEHVIRFVFSTNLPRESQPLEFAVIVRDPPVFDGVLAIDFGTSNSCAAFLSRTQEGCTMGLIERQDFTGDRAKSPTLVQFLNLEGDQAITDYGGRVLTRLGAPETLNSVVRSVKRFLGRTEMADKIPVQFMQNKILKRRYLPREVTTFYLRHVRQALEKNGGMRFRRLAITHPARFKLGQIEDLKQAVRDAFGEVDLTCYQEPIAAGLEHILAGGDENPGAYTLGVFDCGGGTTDLSVIRVEKSAQNGLEELNATLLASSGKWFGGEDLTLEVRSRAVKKIDQNLPTKGGGRLLVAGEEEIRYRSFAGLNDEYLWRWAEKAKLDLLYPNPQPPDASLGPLMVLKAAGVEGTNFRVADILPEADGIKEFLRANIAELADMLQDLVTKNQIAQLDFILLSGMTSSIPLVRTVLQEKFPNSKVVQSNEPKKCVAKGACYLEAILHDALALRLKVHGRAATVSRIGFADWGRSITRKFWELIPAGVPIPDAGLRKTKTLYLRPETIVEVLENDDDDNRLGGNNPNISLVGRFRPTPTLILPAEGSGVEVELCVNADLECSLSGRLSGTSEDFKPFVRVPPDEIRR